MAQRKAPAPRLVPAFTVQSRQKNTQVKPPPNARVFKPKDQISKSNFRKAYERGDFPLQIDHSGQGKKIQWKIPVSELDYDTCLPLFFDGLTETQYPYNFLAEQGIHDIIDGCEDSGRILAVLPYLVQPLKRTLNTKQPDKVALVARLLIKIATQVDHAGHALVPYYRQLLPVLGLFKDKNVNIGDKIEYGQQKKQNLGDLISEILQIFERTGGKDAFINIQYVIPTYQSCLGSR